MHAAASPMIVPSSSSNAGVVARGYFSLNDAERPGTLLSCALVSEDRVSREPEPLSPMRPASGHCVRSRRRPLCRS